MDIHYNLSNVFQSADFVRTGEGRNVNREVHIEPKQLTPTQRAVLETLTPGTSQRSAILWNPEHATGPRSCYFDRYLTAGDVPMILDQLAAQRLQERRETTQPLTFRIHTAALDRVRAYAQEHGLKTDGEALRALIEASLRTVN